MAPSTRNRLPGGVTEVLNGEAVVKVSIRVGENHTVSLITRETADEVSLEQAQEEVMSRGDEGVPGPLTEVAAKSWGSSQPKLTMTPDSERALRYS